MNEKLDAWTVETADLTSRVAAAIGTPSPTEEALWKEIRLLRRELMELRTTTILLSEEVARLRAAPPTRRLVPFGPVEGRTRLS